MDVGAMLRVLESPGEMADVTGSLTLASRTTSALCGGR